jgi:cytochrome subunit of sulfide dehydrogenase
MAAPSTRWRINSLSVEMKARIASSLLAGLILLSSQTGTAADNSQGAQLAATCASCHGPNGSDKGIPAIIGIDRQKITDRMLAYKGSERPSHVMHAIALSLSEEELASVARYLADHDKDGNPR